MMWLLSLLPGLLPKLLDYLNKRQDTALEKYRVGAVSGKEVTIEVIKAEMAGKTAQKEMNLIGANHLIWWVAWAVFVLPVGAYHAMIHFVSTFPHLWFALTAIPASKAVLAVPAAQQQWDEWIVLSIFGLQFTSELTKRALTAWLKKA